MFCCALRFFAIRKWIKETVLIELNAQGRLKTYRILWMDDDNAPAHTSMPVREFLAKNQTIVKFQPP